ncbi:glycosyltransferase [Vibrio sp. 10N.286.51.B11]|uniref:glycosyltransferase n=1 Tax=Vibrio sp. 10N.286.51.B11 TaxID=3229706 RepID=UPI00354DD325
MSNKIVLFLPNLIGGGAERVALNLTNYWVANGYSVDIILVKKKGELITHFDEKVTIHDLDCLTFRQSIIPLYKYLKLHKPSALMCFMWPLTIIGIICKLFLPNKLTVVCREGGMYSNSQKSMKSKFLFMISTWSLYRFANHIVAVSEGVKDDICKVAHLRKSGIKVIGNPININNDIHMVTKDAKKGLRILSVGNLKAAKDYVTLLNTASLLKFKYNLDFSWHVLGEGLLRPELEKLSRKLDVNDVVIFEGFVDDTTSYYRNSDLFVLTSTTEGLPNVMIEALNHGLSVVSTDCKSGPREILQNGKYGTLVEVGNYVKLAEAIFDAKSLNHPSGFYSEAVKRYSIGTISKRYLSLLDADDCK